MWQQFVITFYLGQFGTAESSSNGETASKDVCWSQVASGWWHKIRVFWSVTLKLHVKVGAYSTVFCNGHEIKTSVEGTTRKAKIERGESVENNKDWRRRRRTTVSVGLYIFSFPYLHSRDKGRRNCRLVDSTNWVVSAREGTTPSIISLTCELADDILVFRTQEIYIRVDRVLPNLVRWIKSLVNLWNEKNALSALCAPSLLFTQLQIMQTKFLYNIRKMQ